MAVEGSPTQIFFGVNSKREQIPCVRSRVRNGDSFSIDKQNLESLGRSMWAGHVESLGGEVYTGFRWVNLTEGDHLEDSNIDGNIILRLRWIFRKWEVGAWTGLI